MGSEIKLKISCPLCFHRSRLYQLQVTANVFDRLELEQCLIFTATFINFTGLQVSDKSAASTQLNGKCKIYDNPSHTWTNDLFKTQTIWITDFFFVFQIDAKDRIIQYLPIIAVLAVIVICAFLIQRYLAKRSRRQVKHHQSK